MILDINKQLDEILKEELLQAEVITTEKGKIMRFPNLDVPDIWEVFNNGCHSHFHDVLNNGCEKIGGCIINYRKILKRYLFKTHDRWHECYSINKTSIRKIYSGVTEIVELKSK